MMDLARNGYSADEVRAALLASARHIRFRYELLDSAGSFKANLVGVLACSVANNALADVKRTAHLVLRDGADDIDYLSDRVKPVVRLRMPDGGYAEFPQGVFLLTSPRRAVDAADVVTREVEAYDQLIVLAEDKVTDRYIVAAGTNVIDALRQVLQGAGITEHNLTPTAKVLPADLEWEPGTAKLRVVNDLLAIINYRSLYFDETGRAVGKPYVSPQTAPSEFTYSDDSDSVSLPAMDQTLDLFNISNTWVVVVSEPDRPPLSSTFTNDDPDSPTSTVSRGRTIVDFRTVEAVDQATLDAKAQRLAFEASQIYEILELQTGIMPMHSDADVVTIERSALGISARYSEHTWEMELKAGQPMKHRVRRVVQVGS